MSFRLSAYKKRKEEDMKKVSVLIGLVLSVTFLSNPTFAQGWARLWDGLPAFYGISAVDSSSCWFSGDNGIVVHTKLDTMGYSYYNFWFFPVGPSTQSMTALFAQDNSVACVGSSTGSIYKTANGGGTWTKVYEYSGSGQTFIDGIHFWDQNTGVAFGDPPFYPDTSAYVILRTTDGGSTWTQVTNGVPRVAGQAGVTMDFDAIGNNFMFASNTSSADTTTQRYVFRSTDRGLTWSSIPVPKAIGYFNLAFSDSLHGILNGTNGNCATTIDGGATWKVRYNSVAGGSVAAVHGTGIYWSEGFYSPDSGYAILKSTDFGDSWVKSGASQSSIVGFSVVNSTCVWAGGLDYAILRTDQGDQSPTFVQQDLSNGSGADGFSLLQNYPNPFNPSTTIKYRLPSSEPVRVTVFDVLGRQVKVLVDARQPKGWHQVNWDGQNNENTRVSSGIYFYQIHYGNFNETKKMIILK